MAPRIKLRSLIKENRSTLTLMEKKELLEAMKPMREVLAPLEPVCLEADNNEPDTIVSNVLMTGDIDDNNIVRIDGVVQKALPMDQMERQSISTYQKARPVPPKPANPHVVRYDHMADRNNMTTIIQRMQEGNEFKYVAFQRIVSSGGESGELESPTGGKMKVITTRTFPDGQSGGNVLSDLLKILNI